MPKPAACRRGHAGRRACSVLSLRSTKGGDFLRWSGLSVVWWVGISTRSWSDTLKWCVPLVHMKAHEWRCISFTQRKRTDELPLHIHSGLLVMLMHIFAVLRKKEECFNGRRQMFDPRVSLQDHLRASRADAGSSWSMQRMRLRSQRRIQSVREVCCAVCRVLHPSQDAQQWGA